MISLLARFYDVDGGSISIDGHDIRQLDGRWLRGRAIGYINQVCYYDNLRYDNMIITLYL